MSLDDATANDATLVDDDLVASLGFEPTTTVKAVAGDVLDVRSDVAEFVATDAGEAEVIDLDDAPAARDVDTDDQADGPDSETSTVDELFDDLADTDVADTDHDAVAADTDLADTDDVDADEDAEAVAADTDSDADTETAIEELVEADLLDEDDDDPLFGSADSPLVRSFDDLDEVATDDLADLAHDEADNDIELFDVADDDDLGDDVIDLLTDDLDVPEDLDLSGRDSADTATGFVDEASITSAPDDAAALAEYDDVFAPTADPAVPEPVTATVPAVGAATAIAPAGRRRGKLRARKVRRVIRHVDPWSVLTFSVLFHLVFFSSMLLASILVWNGAVQAGTIDNIENFIRELGDYETFNINSDVVFRAAVVIAGMLTLASSIIVVLLTVVFNLVSDLVGGIRVTVIEEDTVVVPAGE